MNEEDPRWSWLWMAVGFAALVLLWVGTAPASGPPHSGRIVWADAAALAYTDATGVAHFGRVRLTLPGAVGQPIPHPVPPPVALRPDVTTNPCAWIPGGSRKDANGWWHDVTETGPRASVCIWNGPPPLEPCLPAIAMAQRNGYLCTRGATYYPSGAGYYWTPEVRR